MKHEILGFNPIWVQSIDFKIFQWYNGFVMATNRKYENIILSLRDEAPYMLRTLKNSKILSKNVKFNISTVYIYDWMEKNLLSLNLNKSVCMPIVTIRLKLSNGYNFILLLQMWQ